MSPRCSRSRARGFAIIGVMFVMAILMGIGAVLHTSTMSETALRGGHFRATAGFYAAEAGTNRGMGEYRNIFLNYGVPSGSDFAEHAFTMGPRTVRYQLSPVAGFPKVRQIPAGKPFAGLSSQQYKYAAVASSEVHEGDVEVRLGTEFDVVYVPLFQFLAFFKNDLEILPGALAEFHGPIHTNGNLYLNAGTTLTIRELQPAIPSVHVSTSQRVFRGRTDSSTCGGTVSIAKLTDVNLDGALDLRNLACVGSGTNPVPNSVVAQYLGSIKQNQAVVSVPEPDVVDVGSGEFWQAADVRIMLDLENPTASGYYTFKVYNEDGSVDTSRTATLQQWMQNAPGRLFYNDVPIQNGTTGPNGSGDCPVNSYCDRNSYTKPFPSMGAVAPFPALTDAQSLYPCGRSDIGIYSTCSHFVETRLDGSTPYARRGGFYNIREGRWVYMLNLNLRDFLVRNASLPTSDQFFDPADSTHGGIVVFLSVKGPYSDGDPSSAPHRYGVRVFGSPSLGMDPVPAGGDPTGVTVVSDQAMYVEGHYNLRAGQPGYNPLTPKQPASFMGDTMTVLSTNWSGPLSGGGWTGLANCRNDCQSRQSMQSPTYRPASATYINAAFLAGHDRTTTSPARYSGGLQNFPRTLEYWTGTNLVYFGSFVSLGTPQHNNGQYRDPGTTYQHYTIPNRLWDFDSDFQLVQNLPPLTPRVVAVQQIMFTQNFR